MHSHHHRMEERNRRRTHCFSTAGSGHLGVGIKEIGQEVIIRYIAQVMRDDERLREVLAPTLGELADRAGNALADKVEDGSEATSGPPDDAEVAVGLAIIVALFRRRQTVQVEKLTALKN